MADYFVSPRVRTDLRIDPTAFASDLESRWPVARIRTIADLESNHALEWTMPMTYGRLDGSLNRAGQVIALSGDVRDCAEFAVWVRSKVPSAYTLIFYDEGYSADAEVREGGEAQDLVEPFLAPR